VRKPLGYEGLSIIEVKGRNLVDNVFSTAFSTVRRVAWSLDLSIDSFKPIFLRRSFYYLALSSPIGLFPSMFYLSFRSMKTDTLELLDVCI
jgi:hypothetical protein